MSAKFSGALQLTGLDDFITPSQACIKPLGNAQSSAKEENATKDTNPKHPGAAKVRIELEDDGAVMEINTQSGTRTPLQAAQVTLDDCLACSGCVTSAESVLIAAQSGTRWRKALQNEDGAIKKFVLTLSPQACAALAVKYQCSVVEFRQRLQSYCQKYAQKALVVDSNCGRHLARHEFAAQFIARVQHQKKTQSSAPSPNKSPVEGEKLKSKAAVMKTEILQKSWGKDAPQDTGPLPLLTSACPGWVCYAEKRHGDMVLPYISTVKSPQQVVGTLLKQVYAEKLGIAPSQLFHCTVMPCYDKKLEASRSDFYDAKTDALEVDCVLSTAEFGAIIDEDLKAAAAALADVTPTRKTSDSDASASALTISVDGSDQELVKEAASSASQEEEAAAAVQRFLTLLPCTAVEDVTFDLANVRSSSDMRSDAGEDEHGSGGYLLYALRAAAIHFYGQEMEIKSRVGRNQDLREYWIEVEGEKQLLCAQMYGFRNIQTLVRKMRAKSRRARCHYVMVEVMACPSGCLNGGGQIRSQSKLREDARTLLSQVRKRYAEEQAPGDVSVCVLTEDQEKQEEKKSRFPPSYDRIRHLYVHWIGGEPLSKRARNLLHTSYRAVESDINPLAIQW